MVHHSGSNVPPTLGRSNTGYGTYASDCVNRPRAIHPATRQWMSFITYAATIQKYSKMLYIFACNALSCGATVPWLQKAIVELMLSSSWHVTFRLTIFEIFTVKWLFRGPKTRPFPFFGRKISPPKGEKLCPDDRSTPRLFSRRLVSLSPRYLSPDTETQNYSRWLYPTKRTLALRLPDN